MKKKVVVKIDIEGNVVHLKKTKRGYRVIHPIKNEDGTYNMKNLFSGGNWWNLVYTAFAVGLILGVVWEYNQTIQSLLNCIENPFSSEFCIQLKEQLGGI